MTGISNKGGALNGLQVLQHLFQRPPSLLQHAAETIDVKGNQAHMLFNRIHANMQCFGPDRPVSTI